MNRTPYGINIKARLLQWIGFLAVLSLVLAACAPAAAPTAVPPVATNTPQPAPTQAPTVNGSGAGSGSSGQGVTVNVAQNSALGAILVDGNGMTLYMWKNDKAGVSTCAGKCLTNWPPLLASGTVTAGTGLNASDFGTTQTTDGRTMVTYKSAPLYYFIGDKAAGDTKGQGIGNVWYVVAP